MKITLYQIDFKLRVKNDSKIIFYFYRFGSFAKTNSIKKIGLLELKLSILLK